MVKTIKRHSIKRLTTTLLIALCLGCASVNYVESWKAETQLRDIGVGVHHGDLDAVNGLYVNRDYQKSLEGATYLVGNPPNYTSWGLYMHMYELRAQSNFALGDYEAARDDFEFIRRKTDGFEPVKIQTQLAIIDYSQHKDLERAKRILGESGDYTKYLQGVMLSSHNIRYSYFLGLLYLYSGNLYEAQGHFSTSLSLQQSTPPEHKEHGWWNWEVLEMKLFAEFTRVLDMPAADAQEYLQQMYSTYLPEPASIKVSSGYDPYLIELVSQSLGRIHYNHDETTRELAKLLQQNNFTEALEYLGRAYKATRSDAVVQQLGDVLSRHKPQGVSEQSRQYLAQANVYLEKRNYNQAAIAYLNVIEASPWTVDAFFNLAHIYSTAGQRRNAIATMRQYLMLEPQGDRSRNARDSIYRWEIDASSTAN